MRLFSYVLWHSICFESRSILHPEVGNNFVLPLEDAAHREPAWQSRLLPQVKVVLLPINVGVEIVLDRSRGCPPLLQYPLYAKFLTLYSVEDVEALRSAHFGAQVRPEASGL